MLSHPVFLQIFFETRNMTRTIFSRFWWFSISNWFPIWNLGFQLISNMKSLREFNTESCVERWNVSSYLMMWCSVSSCISVLWADSLSFHFFVSVKASFVLLISAPSGARISLRIRIFKQKLDLGMIFYPSYCGEHFTSSGPVSIR